MIQNYIFDLYGTLVDIRTDEAIPSLWRRMALFLSLQGAAYTSNELHQAYLDTITEQIDLCAFQRPNIPKAHIEPDILHVFERLYKRKGISVSTQTVEDATVLFRTLSLRHIRPYPHALKVLNTLRARGKGVYLLSNAQAAFTVPELNILGLTEQFDGIVLSSEVGVKKPDKAIFQQLFIKYGLRPEACLMIGNNAAADIQGAASAGMESRYIHTGISPARPASLPNSCREIYSLQELL